MLASTNLSTLFAEWTLIVFTTFAQFAAGTALFASISHKLDEEEVSYKLFCMAFVLMIIAGIVSILHLQNPFNALYTLTQAAHSWLSREILAVGAFSGLLFLQLIKPSKAIAYLTSFMGIVMVFVISHVYNSVSAMPLWANHGTVIAFIGTMLVMGSAIAFWFVKEIEQSYLRNIARITLVIGILLSLSAKLAWVNVFMNYEALQIPAEFSSSLCLFALQVILSIVGLLLILPKKTNRCSCALSFALICFLFAELAGRTIFFVAQLKVGV